MRLFPRRDPRRLPGTLADEHTPPPPVNLGPGKWEPRGGWTSAARPSGDGPVTAGLRHLLGEIRADRDQLEQANARLIAEHGRLRGELDIERRYSRHLRDTVRRIGALHPVTDSAVRQIISDGIPAANARAADHERLQAERIADLEAGR